MSTASSTLQRSSHAELFTRSECEEILKNVLNTSEVQGELVDFSVIPEAGPIGYLGEYFNLHIRYSTTEDGTKTLQSRRLFVKSMPYTNADMSYFIEKSGILRKEATLYECLLNELRKLSKTTWCAQCYFTRKDLFVMQHIMDLGYEPLKDSSLFLNVPQMNVILKGLATLHACSIGYEVKHNVVIGEQLKDVLFEVTVSPTVDWYTTGVAAVRALIEQHPAYQSVAVQDFIKANFNALVDDVYEMVNPSKKYRNVFCHRDPWGGNVFFCKTQPNEAATVFVDFQLCRYCPAAIDVLMTVYLNMKPKARVAVMQALCSHYYACFAKELQTMNIAATEHMSAEQFENSIKDLQLYGALYNCIASTVIRVPGDFLKSMKQNQPKEFHRYVNIDRTADVLKLIATNAEFGELMRECIEDLMDLILPAELK